MTARKKKVAFEGRKIVGQASIRHVRISPQRLRLVMNLIRGKQVDPALQILEFSPRKGSKIASKLLRSAVANARERQGADIDKMWVAGGYVDAGRTMKRHLPRAHGRADERLQRSSHMTILLEER